MYKGNEIYVAAGAFTLEERKEILENKEKYIWKIIKFRFFGYGSHNVPRHATAQAWRDKFDL